MCLPKPYSGKLASNLRIIASRCAFAIMEAAEIEATINYPDYLKTGQTGRKVAVKDVKGRPVTVVFVEEETYLKVITVY